MSPDEKVIALTENSRIESLMTANHAEAVNGLLYVSGGGWDQHHRQIAPGGPPPASPVGFALMVYIPWGETNQRHQLDVIVESDDGASLLELNAPFSVGRPAHLTPGTGQHLAIAMNGQVQYPAAGGYRVVARLDEGRDTKTWAFRVFDLPPTGLMGFPPAISQ